MISFTDRTGSECPQNRFLDRNKPLGFSLLELLIVLTLMSVFIGVIVPASRTWIHRTEEANINAIWEEAIRTARSQAMESGLTHTVRFDKSTSCLLVAPESVEPISSSECDRPTRFPCPQKTIINLTIGKNNAPINKLRIDPNGNAESVSVEIQRNSISNRFRNHRYKSRLITIPNPL